MHIANRRGEFFHGQRFINERNEVELSRGLGSVLELDVAHQNIRGDNSKGLELGYTKRSEISCW